MGLLNGVAKFGKSIYSFAKAHKTTICLAGGCACLGVAVVDSGRNTIKAVRKVEDINAIRAQELKSPLTKKEIVKECAPLYISTACWAFAGYVGIGYAYKVKVNQLASMTLFADAAKRERDALRDAIDDILPGEENRETKQKIADRYSEKLYGDGNQPIDRFIPSENRSKGNKVFGHSPSVERYKDPYGGEFFATASDLRYAKLDIIRTLESGWGAGLPDFYAAVSDDADYPVNAHNYIWDINNWPQERVSSMLKSFDIRREERSDIDGLYWQLSYTIEPSYIPD